MKLTEAARKRLEESYLAELVTDYLLAEFEQDEDHVTVFAQRKLVKRKYISQKYLIGADGARSTIRAITKVGFPD